MTKFALDNPVFDGDAFDVLEVLDVVSYHRQAFCLGCTTDEKVEVFYFVACIPKLGNTGAGVEHVSFHSSTSKWLEVRMLRMSLTISSAERLSFHAPQKRSAQWDDGLDCSLRVMELLSKVMSSNLTLSLRSFSSDQYRALANDGDGRTLVFIFISFYFRCKFRC